MLEFVRRDARKAARSSRQLGGSDATFALGQNMTCLMGVPTSPNALLMHMSVC